MRTFIREKRIYCGKDHMEVDIIPLTNGHLKKKRRKKREKVSAPSQRNLNDKNAKRYFSQLVKANFGKGDLHVTCTYKPKYLPKTIEEAEKEVTNFIRRINYRRKKMGLKNAKYIIITETKDKQGKQVKVHHHIFISGMDRDLLEDLWSKKGESMGFVNADRLQVDGDGGLIPITRYLTKNRAGKKRWRGSQNLTRPEVAVNDSKYSKRKLNEMAMIYDEDKNFWNQKYPGWNMVTCESIYNDITGWAIYLVMERQKK